jgi:AcrR family transcriptional regulator
METQLLDTATKLFARKGYESTTLEDIAGEMGISRPALYHYVSSKARLLEMLVEQVTQSMADVLEHLAAREDLSDGQKLTSVVALMVRQRAEHPDQFRILDRSETVLPEKVGAEHLKAKRAILRDLATMIGHGAERGEFRPVEPRVAALSVLGMCNWVAWWFHPGNDVDAVVEQITGHAQAMLLVPPAEGSRAEVQRLADEIKTLADQLHKQV